MMTHLSLVFMSLLLYLTVPVPLVEDTNHLLPPSFTVSPLHLSLTAALLLLYRNLPDQTKTILAVLFSLCDSEVNCVLTGWGGGRVNRRER